MSGNSLARSAFGKGLRQAVPHLLFHSLKQLHSRSARRKVALDLFIPAGTIPLGDPGGQGGLLFGRQFHNGVLNLGELARIRDSSATNRGAGI